jgi:murein hydrolase activator
MLSILKTNIKITKFFIRLCFLGCFVFLATADCLARDRVLFKGVVTAAKLNVRAKASQYSNVVMVLERGTSVDVVGKEGGIGGWLTVVHGGNRGYIRNRPKYVRLTRVEAVKKIRPKPRKVVKQAPQVSQNHSTKKITREKIAKAEEKVAAFSIKEMEVIEGLNEIDYGLNQARLKSRTLAQETKALAIKNAKIRESKEILAAQMDQDQSYAGQRLNALYRMYMIGSLDIAGAPSSVFDFVLTQNAMKQVVQSDLQVLETQDRDLKALSLLDVELAQQVVAKTDLEAELNLQIRIKEKETLKKEAILYEIQRKKNLSQAALLSLKTSASDLNDKMSAMDQQVLSSVENSIGSTGGSLFSGQKGRLRIPVQGKIVSVFGTLQNGDYKSFTFQSGIDIKVERGEPVRSVFKGEVLFAQWLKGYGNMIIINHGDNYYTLYAHVEEIFKKKGEAVDTGEVIATAGDTGSIKGLYLHFEVRHHGKPVNPMQWIRKGA